MTVEMDPHKHDAMNTTLLVEAQAVMRRRNGSTIRRADLDAAQRAYGARLDPQPTTPKGGAA